MPSNPTHLTVRSGFMASIVPEAKAGPFVLALDGPGQIVQALDFGVRHNVHTVDLLVSSASQVDATWLNEQLYQRNLTIGALGSGGVAAARKVFFTHPDQANREAAVAAVLELIELGSRLGENGVPVIIGSVQGQRFSTSTKQTPDQLEWPLIEQAHDFLAECLMQLGQRAFDLGVPLVYEVLNSGESNLFHTLAQADEFIQALECDSIEFLLDSYHWLCQGWTIQQVRALKTKVGYAHIVGHNRRPACSGPDAWHSRLDEFAMALNSIGYDGHMIAECLPLPDADSAMSSTMEWLEANFGC